MFGRFRVRNSTSPRSEIPSSVESKLGIRSYTDFVVGGGAENNCAGRGAEAIDDDRLSGGSEFFILIYIAPDLPASVISNPNYRMACACIHKQEHCREHRRQTFHASCPPQVGTPSRRMESCTTPSGFSAAWSGAGEAALLGG